MSAPPSTRPLALITGASSGIGAVFAHKLAARGCDVLLVARRKDKLEQTAQAIRTAYGVDAEILPADLTDDAELRAVADRIKASPSLHYLVNNAGFGTKGYFHNVSIDMHERMHKLQVFAPMRLTHAALQVMVRKNQGNIVNVASVSGFGQTPGSLSYSATKLWMISFTEGLYLELKSARSPIRVQALCPGFTLSEFHDTMQFDRKGIPSGMWMSADEVVDTSLRELDRDKVIVIPGLRYRLLVRLMRSLPGPLYRSIAIAYARKTGRDR